MENNKITSVAWLINQIKEDQTIKAKSMSEWNTVFEQAKEMHKEEIKSAYKEGCFDSILDESTDKVRSEQYYNETFKSK